MKHEKAPVWRVGQLVQTARPQVPLAQLHPHFVQPKQIFEGLKLFWGKSSNLHAFGLRDLDQPNDARFSRALPFPKEWQTALEMEYTWELKPTGIRREDICKIHGFNAGTVFMVTEVIATPWKKKYMTTLDCRRHRFAYVKLLGPHPITGESTYFYDDISANCRDTKMITTRFIPFENGSKQS